MLMRQPLQSDDGLHLHHALSVAWPILLVSRTHPLQWRLPDPVLRRFVVRVAAPWVASSCLGTSTETSGDPYVRLMPCTEGEDAHSCAAVTVIGLAVAVGLRCDSNLPEVMDMDNGHVRADTASLAEWTLEFHSASTQPICPSFYVLSGDNQMFRFNRVNNGSYTIEVKAGVRCLESVTGSVMAKVSATSISISCLLHVLLRGAGFPWHALHGLGSMSAAGSHY